MGRRLILDTTELITWERTETPPVELDDDVAIGAISLAELELGAHQAQNPNVAERRHRFVATIRNLVDVLPYTGDTAREHAVLLSHVKNTGKPRGAHDLIIAAHARETGREILSADLKARFGDLPGVKLAWNPADPSRFGS